MDIKVSLYKRLRRKGLGTFPLVKPFANFYMNLLVQRPYQVNGKMMFIDTSFLHYLEAGEQDKEGLDFIKKHLDRDSIAIDIGANIGYYSLFMSDYCKKVYAFEPSSHAYALLCRNIKINNLEDKIVPLQLGVSNRAGMAKLYLHPHGAPSNTLTPTGNRHETIKITTLDEYFRERNDIKFIKCDVEGYEEEVLLGGTETIKRQKKLGMHLEHNAEHLKEERGKTGEEVISLLYKLGFEYKLDYEAEGVTNLLCEKKQS